MEILKNYQKNLEYPIYRRIQNKVYCYDCEELITEKGLIESANEIDEHIKDSNGICNQMEIKTVWYFSRK